jgi:hypothetical protein
MDEAGWLSCTDPTVLLAFLRDRGTASERKLRLFAAACCRRIWHLLKDEQGRNAVEVAELYADGLAERDALVRALKALPMPEWPGGGPEIFNWRLVTSGIAADMTDPRTYVWLTAESSVPELTPALVAAKWADEGACFVAAPIQAGILHELFGNPFRPVASNPAWRTLQVRAIAAAAYEQRSLPNGTLDGTRLAVLADALEDAGCTDAGLLGHLRGPWPHVRGCFALDLLVGRE